MIDALDDPRRVDPPLVAGGREMLEAWLEFHRVTLLLKCEGLTDEERKRRPVGSSSLSLHGLVRHMTDVERSWFQWTLRGSRPAELPPRYWRSEDSELDFVPLDGAVWEDDRRAWESECGASREATGGLELEHVTRSAGRDARSLRWIYVHMIEEYARHNGHADLLREMIDGAVGD